MPCIRPGWLVRSRLHVAKDLDRSAWALLAIWAQSRDVDGSLKHSPRTRFQALDDLHRLISAHQAVLCMPIHSLRIYTCGPHLIFRGGTHTGTHWRAVKAPRCMHVRFICKPAWRSMSLGSPRRLSLSITVYTESPTQYRGRVWMSVSTRKVCVYRSSWVVSMCIGLWIMFCCCVSRFVHIRAYRAVHTVCLVSKISLPCGQ